MVKSVSSPSRERARAGTRLRSGAVRRQRGVAAIYAAVSVVAMITATLLAINVGQLYFAQRDLQKQASLAAIAGAQFGSGCRNQGYPATLLAVSGRVATALNNNATAFTGGQELLSTINGAPSVELGSIDTSTGMYKFVSLTPSGDETISAQVNPNITAVRVNLKRAQPPLIGGFLGLGGGNLWASATAYQPSFANFMVASGAATFDSVSSPLFAPIFNTMLGSNVTDAQISNSQLLTSQLTLAQLETAAGVTNFTDLLNLQTDLATAVGIVQTALAGSSTTAAGFVGGLKINAGPTTNYFGQVINNFGNTINPAPTDLLASLPFADGLDLLMALGEEASLNQNLLLTLDATTQGQLNPAGTTTKIYIDVSQQAILTPQGPPGDLNTARSEQITFKVRYTSTQSINIIITTLNVTTTLGTDFLLASGTGTLTSLQCPVGGQPNPEGYVNLAVQAGQFTFGSFNPAQADPALTTGNVFSFSAGSTSILTLALANQDISTNLGTSGNHDTGPFDTYDAGVSNAPFYPHSYTFVPIAPNNVNSVDSYFVITDIVNALVSGLSNKNNLTITFLNVNFSSILDPVLGVLNIVLTPLAAILEIVLDYIGALTGAQVGTTCVIMNRAYIAEPTVLSTALPVPSGT